MRPSKVCTELRCAMGRIGGNDLMVVERVSKSGIVLVGRRYRACHTPLPRDWAWPSLASF
jgi:hypothetical protein